jgi:hypothetical protein
MNCIFNISLSISEIIAILSLPVAVLSAVYARWSSMEAKKANQIGLLIGRKEIYIAFLNLKMHMKQCQCSAELAEVSKFYYLSINACMYFPASLAQDITDYYDACFGIAETYQREGIIKSQSREDLENHFRREKELSSTINEKILKIFQNMNLEPKFKFP